jgi:FHS family glucose/mannose:H+ symporter-like MFS transporter
VSALARAAIAVFGVVMALVGAVAPVVSAQVRIGLGDLGTVFLVMNGAMLAASLGLGMTVDRLGHGRPLVLGAWLVAAALALMGRAGDVATLLLGAAALGAGGGVLNGVANMVVADQHRDERARGAALNALGVYFGIGALVLPFTVGLLTARLGLPAVLDAAAALCVLLGVAALVPRWPRPETRHGWPLARAGTWLRQPAVAALAALLFFQSGNEFLLGGYVSTLLTTELGMLPAGAAYVVAAFWAAIMASRLGMSWWLRKIDPASAVMGGAVGASLACAALAASGSAAMAVAAAAAAGLLLAPIFPTVLGVAAARASGDTAPLFGVLFAVALTGGMTVPWLAGHLAAATGVRTPFVLAAVNFLAVARAMYVSRRQSAGSSRVLREVS